MIKAGFPESATNYFEVKQEAQLTIDEIREQIYGHKMIGRFWGGEWKKNISTEGEFIYTRDYTNEIGKDWYDSTFPDNNEQRHVTIKGRSWIKGNMNCWESEDHFNGLKTCENLYRNPKGKAEVNQIKFRVSR